MSLSVFWSSWTLPDLASVQWPSPRPRLVNACTKNKGNLLLHLLPLFMASIYEIVIPYELVLHFLNPFHSLSEKCSDIKIWVSLLSHAWKRRCLDLDRTDQAHVGNMARLGQIMPPVPLCPCVNCIEKLPPSFVFACLKYLGDAFKKRKWVNEWHCTKRWEGVKSKSFFGTFEKEWQITRSGGA